MTQYRYPLPLTPSIQKISPIDSLTGYCCMKNAFLSWKAIDRAKGEMYSEQWDYSYTPTTSALIK